MMSEELCKAMGESWIVSGSDKLKLPLDIDHNIQIAPPQKKPKKNTIYYQG